MKSFYLAIVGVILSASFGLWLGNRVFALPSKTALLDRIFEEADVRFSDSSDARELEKLADDSALPFENLYLFMLMNVSKGPEEAAIAELQNRLKVQRKRAYSENELKAILWEGKMDAITARFKLASEWASDPELTQQSQNDQAEADLAFEDFMAANSFDDTLTGFYEWTYQTYVRPDALTEGETPANPSIDVVLREYTTLYDWYERELAIQRQTRKLGYMALASEMFVNGNTLDSAGIDLLSDLNTAHVLLFGKDLELPDRGGSAAELASIEDFAEQDLSLFPAQDPVVLASELSDLNARCLDDTELRTALDVYSQTGPLTDPRVEPNSSSVFYPALETSSTGFSDSNSDNEDGLISIREQTQAALKTLDTLSNTLSEGPGDWTRSLPCTDIFCVTVSRIPQTESMPALGDENLEPYRPTDHCIACHLSFLTDRLEETVAGPLVPGKISMNYFEDATCKQGGFLSELDFHVRAVPKPIALDPFDELDDVPAQATQTFLDQLAQLGALPNSSSASQSTPDASTDGRYATSFQDQECTAILHAAQLGGAAPTIETVQAACNDAFERWDESVQEAFRRFEFESNVDTIVGPYEQIVAELLALKSLFASLEEGLILTYDSQDAPLPSLLAKPYCQ